jgi:hypothetical protein
MFPDLPVPPEFVLSRQILAVLLAGLGAFLLLCAQHRQRDVLLALGLGGLAVGIVACVMWIGAESPAMYGWLAVILISLSLTVWRLRRR